MLAQETQTIALWWRAADHKSDFPLPLFYTQILTTHRNGDGGATVWISDRYTRTVDLLCNQHVLDLKAFNVKEQLRLHAERGLLF